MMNRTVARAGRRGVAFAACAALTGGGATAADTAPAADQIVVTADRRAAPLRETPGSLSVTDAAALARINADHIQEALNRTPGVFLHRGSGREHLTAIRSPVLTGGAGAGSFLFLEDGVPLRAAGFANVNGLFESVSELADAIEVTRGPGSAVYGSNAVHGLVNVLTPTPGEPGVRYAASTGSFGRAKGQAIVSRGGAEAGLLAGASLLHEGGWREDAGVDEQKLTVRWTGSAGAWRADAGGAFVNLNQETAGFAQGEEIYRFSELARANAFPEAFRDAKAGRARVRLTRDLGAEASLAVTPFARWNDMDFLQHFLPSRALEETGHWSVGAQSALYWSARDGLDVTLGADVEYTQGFLRQEQEIPDVFSFVQGVQYDYEVDAIVAAPFVQAAWALSPRWTLEGGLRVEATFYDYVTNTPADDVGRFRRPADRSDDFTAATPKLALRRRVGEDGRVYLRYARGARAPQTTDLYRLQTNQEPGAAEVERLDSVEGGWRGRLGPVWADLAAYAMEKENFFFRDADGFNVPDGRTRHVGVEGQLAAPVTDTLAFAGSASYARHTYRFDRPVQSVPNATEAIRSGDDVDTAPRWLANARLSWTPLASVEAELEWVYVGAYFMDASNSVVYPGHNLINLRAEWRARPALSVFAAVRNAANRDYAERADFAFGSERYFPGEDRAFSVGVRGAF